MVRRKEVDHYDEICRLIDLSVSSGLPDGWRVVSVNNVRFHELKSQVREVCRVLEVDDNSELFPSVRPDIVVGVRDIVGNLRFALIEVKGPASSIGLIDYSQMFGYLHVAGRFNVGVLLLIESEVLESPISKDLQRVIDGGWLSGSWTHIPGRGAHTRECRSGIARYVPGGSIDWIDLQSVGGISMWSEFVSEMVESKPV